MNKTGIKFFFLFLFLIALWSLPSGHNETLAEGTEGAQLPEKVGRSDLQKYVQL